MCGTNGLLMPSGGAVDSLAGSLKTQRAVRFKDDFPVFILSYSFTERRFSQHGCILDPPSLLTYRAEMSEVLIQNSPINGLGVFTERSFQKGEMLVEIDDSRIVD